MPIECQDCRTTREVVFYRKGVANPRRIRNLKILVLAAAVIAIYDVGALLFNVLPWTDAATSLEDVFLQDPQPGEELLRDAVRIFSNTAYYFFLIIFIGLFYVPIRYFLLLRRIDTGHPRIYYQLRFIAKIQLAVQIFGVLTILTIFSNTEVIEVYPNFGINLILAPVILLYSRLPDFQRYFSVHRVLLLPEEAKVALPVAPPLPPPPEPAPATFQPEPPTFRR